MPVRLKCLAPRPMAFVRVICLPYAGGGASVFQSWAAAVPKSIELYALQLPGREDRLAEPLLTGWAAMMNEAKAALDSLPRLPIALFGYSLGAVIALDLARWLTATKPGMLQHVFCAARPWPGAATSERQGLHALSDAALLEALDRQYGSLSTSLSHPEIRELALPILRADLALLESYRWQPSARLTCPMTVYGGRHDPVTPPASLDAWRAEFAGAFDTVLFEGSHFFLETQRTALIADLVQRLRR